MVMATATGRSYKHLFFCFCCLSILNAISSEATPLKGLEPELQREEEQIPVSSRRGLNNLLYKTTEIDSINPVTTPALNAPPANQVPPVVTVPATVPNTNPVNSPIPATNPVTTPSTIPGVGQSWCIAKNGASQTALQAALDYACGIGKADCASIQQGTSCYNPNSLQNHASFAFNSYYQKNPGQTSCDFGGVAVITITNPSSGSCVYPSSASSSSPAVGNQTTITSPTPTASSSPPASNLTTIPTPAPTTTPPPTTSSSSSPAIGNQPIIPAPTTSSGGAIPGGITPPSVLNSSSVFPDSGTATGFGAAPPIMNSSFSSSAPIALRPFIGCLAFVTSTTMGRFILHM